MEFLGFDIYLVIVVVAAILVFATMFFLSKIIGRKPAAAKQVGLLKSGKLTGLKPRPVSKQSLKKSKVAPVARPAFKKRSVVPVAGAKKGSIEEPADKLPVENESGTKASTKQSSSKGKTGKTAENNEEFDSMQMLPEGNDVVAQEAGEQNVDELPIEPENYEPELSEDQGGNAEGEEGPIEHEGEPAAAQDSLAGLSEEKKEENEEEPKEGGGLLDIFEEEEAEDTTMSMLASKLEDIDSRSLEEIGKEISQSLFNKC